MLKYSLIEGHDGQTDGRVGQLDALTTLSICCPQPLFLQTALNTFPWKCRCLHQHPAHKIQWMLEF
jgi:hypothetical protein